MLWMRFSKARFTMFIRSSFSAVEAPLWMWGFWASSGPPAVLEYVRTSHDLSPLLLASLTLLWGVNSWKFVRYDGRSTNFKSVFQLVSVFSFAYPSATSDDISEPFWPLSAAPEWPLRWFVDKSSWKLWGPWLFLVALFAARLWFLLACGNASGFGGDLLPSSLICLYSSSSSTAKSPFDISGVFWSYWYWDTIFSKVLSLSSLILASWFCFAVMCSMDICG